MATEIPLKNAPKQSVKIQGVTIEVPAPYKEGHSLRAVEATALNSYYAEALRGNIASAIKEMKEKGETNFQEVVNSYVKEYDFGQRRGGGGRPANPVEAELKNIARTAVKRAIVKQGHKLKDVSTEKFNELVSKAMEKHPEWRKMAEENVKQQEAMVDDIQV